MCFDLTSSEEMLLQGSTQKEKWNRLKFKQKSPLHDGPNPGFSSTSLELRYLFALNHTEQTDR